MKKKKYPIFLEPELATKIGYKCISRNTNCNYC